MFHAATKADLTRDLSTWIHHDALKVVLWLVGSIVVARLVALVGQWLMRRIDRRDSESDSLVKSENTKRRHALTQVVTWVIVVVIYVLGGLKVIELMGFDLTAVVPAASLAGVAVGFGAQRIVQDLLAGFFILAERQYGYGDLVRISVAGIGAPVLGTVEEVSLRITTVRTPAGEVVMTPNGQIAQITNLSRGWARAVIDVPIPVTVDVTRATEILRSVGAAAYADEALRALLLDEPAVMGVESMEVDQFQIRIVARTLPGKQFDVSRRLRGLITRALLAEGVVADPSVVAEPERAENNAGGDAES